MQIVEQKLVHKYNFKFVPIDKIKRRLFNLV